MELVLEAISTLTVNKLRTALATLGIVIGIGSVIALISLGQASQKSIQSQIQSLGANLLTISPGAPTSGAVRGAAGGGTTLTLDDANAIKNDSQINTITNVSPEYAGRTQIKTGESNTNAQVIGVTPVYPTVHEIQIASGTFITQRDVDQMAKVAVIGPTVATNLFNDASSDVIGQTIRISGQSFTVVGITQSKGGTGFNNADNIVYIPLSTAQKQIFGADYLTSIALEASSPDVMNQTANAVGFLLLQRHHLSDPTKADFSIFSQQDILNTASQATGTFTTLLSGVAAISLLVGGIGIMNIMLVTVTERTREIGLRKALGAKRRIIIAQFLVESIILTFTGGLIGIVFGLIASIIFSHLTGLPFVLSPSSVILAFVVSTGIGILFGWYPARRAASLQPIEALRYE